MTHTQTTHNVENLKPMVHSIGSQWVTIETHRERFWNLLNVSMYTLIEHHAHPSSIKYVRRFAIDLANQNSNHDRSNGVNAKTKEEAASNAPRYDQTLRRDADRVLSLLGGCGAIHDWGRQATYFSEGGHPCTVPTIGAWASKWSYHLGPNDRTISDPVPLRRNDFYPDAGALQPWLY